MRKLRVKSKNENASYHVMTRTNNKAFTLSDELKDEVIDPWLEIYKKVFYIDCHNHTDMDNHYHISCTVHKPEMDMEDLQRRYEFLQEHLSRAKKWNDSMAEKFYERITDLSDFMKTFNWRVSWEGNRRNKWNKWNKWYQVTRYPPKH